MNDSGQYSGDPFTQGKPVLAQRIVVVLGMHRSGTSVLARALATLGVELGVRLMPAVAGVNDKGFFEDIDIVRINDDLLQAVGVQWDSPSQDRLHSFEWAPQAIEHAARTLREKLDGVNVFGIKDPRMSRLLPFWLKAFALAGIQPVFLVALRDPLSVAESLGQRDGFAPIKSAHLWVLHTLDALRGCAAFPALVVGFDRLVNDPLVELERIGKRLGLTPPARDSQAFVDYLAFLDTKLVHATHAPGELVQAFDSLSKPVLDLYRLMLLMAEDGIALESAEVRAHLDRLDEQLTYSEGLASYAAHLESILAKQAADAVYRTSVYLGQDDQSFDEERRIALRFDAGSKEPRVESITRFGLRGASVRIDPIDVEGVVFLDHVAMLDGQGKVVWSLEEGVACHSDNTQLLWTGLSGEVLVLGNDADPWLKVKAPAEAVALKLRVRRAGMEEIRRALAHMAIRFDLESHTDATAVGRFTELGPQAQEAGGPEAGEGEKEISLRLLITQLDEETKALQSALTALHAENRRVQLQLDENEARQYEDRKTIDAQLQALAEARHLDTCRRAHIDELEGVIFAHDLRDERQLARIQELEALVDAKDCAVRELLSTQSALESARQRSERLAAHLTAELTRVYESISWRSTHPLRLVRRVTSTLLPPYRLGGKVFQSARSIFRSLPLSEGMKQRLRARVLFGGRAFSLSTTIQGAPGLSPLPVGVSDVPGQHRDAGDEDSGYERFKRRLETHAVAKHRGSRVSPRKLIQVSQGEGPSVAAELMFQSIADPVVSIVVPVFGNLEMTLECLLSIANAKVDVAFEVIVADDASPDHTGEVLATVRGIRLQRNTENLGFLRNCNAAFKLARGSHIVILNNDVQVSDGWLDGLLDIFHRYPDAGAAGPRIVYPSGHLQEAGVAFRHDGSADMVGLNDDPQAAQYGYTRVVDYCSGAALMVPAALLAELGGFCEDFAPAYCEDADLCLRIEERGLRTYYVADVTVVHHLSRTMAAGDPSWKLFQVSKNLSRLYDRWAERLEAGAEVKLIAFYLPQFHAIPENDEWWGAGFTEWTNVRKAKPNFVGHDQPRIPGELGYYHLDDPTVLERQAALAREYGVDGFCFYYYWFGGKRLLEMPLERMLATGRPDFPFCLCWANENWSRRWDGRDSEILIGQRHSAEDDRAVILDLIRYFRSPNYIRINGRPHLLVYRVDLFPDFAGTAALWREVCREEGVGEIYLSMVESHDLVHKSVHPSTFGCDAAVEFPPLNMAEQTAPSGELINPDFAGGIADYRETAFRYCTRELPAYKRFRGVMPGWDNTARRQNNGFCFEHATPDVFQAWLEHVTSQTRIHASGDERLIFVNAWNEWAEGAYLEPDERWGRAFLQAVRNARDAGHLLRVDSYRLGTDE